MMNHKYTYTICRLVVIVSVLFSICNFANAQETSEYEDRIKLLYQEHLKIGDSDPFLMQDKWEQFISECPVPEIDIEAQYYISRIISAKKTGKEYLSYLRNVLESYSGDPHHYLYLKMLITYGQVIAKESDRDGLFRRILILSSEDLIYPVTGRGSRSYKQLKVSLRRGSVWAMIHEKTRKLQDLSDRVEMARKVSLELNDLPESDELQNYAQNWIESDTRRLASSAESNHDEIPPPKDTTGPAEQEEENSVPHVPYVSNDYSVTRDAKDTPGEQVQTTKRTHRKIVPVAFVVSGLLVILFGIKKKYSKN